jgi:hypothetical protein
LGILNLVLGLLVKMIFLAATAGALGVGYTKLVGGQGINLSVDSVLSSVKSVDVSSISGKLSQGLDALVTHPGRSPVVMGIEITGDSLKTITDTLSGLPPDQLEQIKQYICQPATESAR